MAEQEKKKHVTVNREMFTKLERLVSQRIVQSVLVETIRRTGPEASEKQILETADQILMDSLGKLFPGR